MMPNTPDSITINGVTITRQQWELINQHGTWEAFVAANTPKPEHVKGERCALPVWNNQEEAKYLDFFYDEFVENIKEARWIVMGSGEIAYTHGCIPLCKPRWTLTAVPKQPKPEYKVGDWVVPPTGKPCQIVASSTAGPLYYTKPGLDAYQESDLRLATREDFMKEFGGVRVWMETDEWYTYGHYILGQVATMRPVLNAVEILIYHAAGVMDMPKEFWK